MEAETIHKESIVFDGTCPLLNIERYIDWWIQGGVTVAAPSVGGEDVHRAIVSIGRWTRLIERRSDQLMPVTIVDDFQKAKDQGKMGILFHFQNTLPIARDLELVQVYHKLGIRVIQLTYNVKNFVGDGCDERTDAGLSDFGVKVIREMNRVGIAVDCSHTGVKTTLDAMEVSEYPVVFSHGNARGVCDNRRNLTDEQIKKLASVGGVIGMNGYPAFVAKKEKPTLDDLVDHVAYIADLVGIDHVGIGIDFYPGQAGVTTVEQSRAMYEEALASGRWKAGTYPPPPYYFPQGLEDPRGFPNLTATLLKRGFSVEDTKKVLGLNFMRVYAKIWK